MNTLSFKSLCGLAGCMFVLPLLSGCGGGGDNTPYTPRYLRAVIVWSAPVDEDLIVTRQNQAANSSERCDNSQPRTTWGAIHSPNATTNNTDNNFGVEFVDIPSSVKNDEPYIAYAQNHANRDIQVTVLGGYRGETAPRLGYSIVVPANQTREVMVFTSSSFLNPNNTPSIASPTAQAMPAGKTDEIWRSAR